jgi:hypothetical protein
VLALVGGSILAIILGHVAVKQIDRSGGREGGGGMAVAGLVLGYLELIVGGIVLLWVLSKMNDRPF